MIQMGCKCISTVEKKTLHFFIIVICCMVTHGNDINKGCRLSKVKSNDGDYQLIGFFPITNAISSKMFNQALLWSEMMRYEIARSNTKYHPKKIFGYTLYDTCTTELDVISEAIMEVLLESNTIRKYYNGKYCPCINKNFPLFKTIGIIGPARSSSTQYVNELLLFEHLPVISYASTSPELGDRMKYPNFFRTAPPDTFQAKFIRDILIKFDWMYVSILASDDIYGRYGLQYLKTEIESRKICIGLEETISSSIQEKELENVVRMLKQDKIGKVIILWAHFNTIQTILKTSHRYGIEDKTWIISEASGRNDWFISNDNQLNGTFLITVPDSGRNIGFENYFWNLTYQSSINNPWLEKFFQKHHINNTHNTHLTMNHFRYLFDTGSVAGYVEKAVSIYVQALEEFMKDTISCDVRDSKCDTTSIISHELFNAMYINGMKFREANNEIFQFNKHGEIANPAFDLLLATKNSFQIIIHWSALNGLKIKNLQLARQLSIIESHCSRNCSPGFYPVFSAVKECCWQCIFCTIDYVKPTESIDYCTQCPFNHISNKDRTKCIMLKYSYIRYRSTEAYTIYILSTVGIIAGLTIMITFILARDTPVVKSSNIRISLVQLTFHIILFSMSYLFLERETKAKCIARTYVIGILFIIIIATTLSKITHIVSVFNLKYRLTKWKVIQLKTTELLIITLSIIVKVCVSIVLLEYSPIVMSNYKDRIRREFHEKCNIDSQSTFQVCYILILEIICGIQAFRGRKLPANYNEAKYVSFAMFTSTLIIVAGISIASSMEEPNHDKLVISVTTILANMSLLLILYGYKVKIIWFYPHLNSTEVFQRERMERMAIEAEKKMSTVTCVSIQSLNDRNKLLVQEIIQRHKQMTRKIEVNEKPIVNAANETPENNLPPIRFENNYVYCDI